MATRRMERLDFGAPGLRLEQMLVAGPVVGNRVLERAKRGGPKFHAIQVLTQPFEGLDQVPHNQIFCLFRHYYSPLSPIGHFLLLEDKWLGVVLFRDGQSSPEANLGDNTEPFAPKIP